ncbi:MAG: hypothetical protein J6V72_16770 [Kiritimatiellae bacterium]|nr:hypothetical protein [Kiritimatiellia bacterium]
MRWMVAIAVFAATFCVAFADVVPQTSADKYYFTRPRHPAGIKGVVMGAPPEYKVMRSEDVSWIEEARQERKALMGLGGSAGRDVFDVPEFGKWPVSAINGYTKWVTATFYENGALTTNIVARYRTETNNLSTTMMKIGSSRDGLIGNADFVYLNSGTDYAAWGYLDPSATNTISSSQVQEIEGNWDWPMITNVTETVTTNWSGAYRDETGWHRSEITNVTYVTMAMTNGTTSVHTNKWVEAVPREERKSVTNVVELSWGLLVFDNRSPKFLMRESPPLKGLFKSSAITNCYPILRDAKRILRPAYFGTVSNTSVYATYAMWSDSDDDGPESTNATTRTDDWRGVCSKSFSSTRSEAWYVIPEAEDEYQTWDNNGRVGSVGSPEEQITAIVDLGIENWVVFTGGVRRVEKVEVFAGFTTEYQEMDHAYDDSSGESQDRILDVKKAVLLKIGETSTIEEGAEWNAVCAISFNAEALCDTAMSAAGHSFHDFGWYPALHYETPKPGTSLSTRSYDASLQWLGVIIHVRPWTSLPGW